MENTVIGLNGPPESGKDTFYSLIKKHAELRNIPIYQVMFKGGIFKGMDLPYLLSNSDAHYESLKARGYEDYRNDNKSLTRQLLIDFSEKVIKPNLGNDFWAKKTIQEIKDSMAKNPPALYVITDVGFDIEYESLKNEFGKVNFVSVHIEREGKTFEGDSRNKVKHDILVTNTSMDGLEESAKFVLEFTCSNILYDDYFDAVGL